MPALPTRLRGGSPGEPFRRLQVGPLRPRLLGLPPLRRGGRAPGLERLRHHLLWLVQPALCLLSELGDQPEGRGGGGHAGRAGPAHAPAPGRGVPQHQLRDPRARGPPDPGGAAPGRGGRAPAFARLQHQRLRQPALDPTHGGRSRHLHAGLQALGPRAAGATSWRRTIPRPRARPSAGCTSRWACSG